MEKKEYKIIEIFFTKEELLRLIIPDAEEGIILENVMPELEGFTVRLRKLVN